MTQTPLPFTQPFKSVVQVPLTSQSVNLLLGNILAPYSTRQEDQLVLYVCVAQGVCAAQWSGMTFGVTTTQPPNTATVHTAQPFVSQISTVVLSFSPYVLYMPGSTLIITIPVYYANQCICVSRSIVDNLHYLATQNLNPTLLPVTYKNTVSFSNAITSYLDILNADTITLTIVGLRNAQISQPLDSFGIQIYDPAGFLQD